MATSKTGKKDQKREHVAEKTRLHPRNRHRARYDFTLLTEMYPPLRQEVKVNVYGDETIDFGNANAVKCLNKALLMLYYDIKFWDIPENYLCPPIPGRADYVHYVADLIRHKNFDTIPTGEGIRCLDIGTGANCIYPIIGVKEYGWFFTGSDTDEIALQSAQNIIQNNPMLLDRVNLRHQTKPEAIFKNIIHQGEFFDVTLCNPPFYASADEAHTANQLKNKHLHPHKTVKNNRNFGGQPKELWYPGGEETFVRQMISESTLYQDQCFWFTTLISRQSHVRRAHIALEKVGAKEINILPMGQGNKTSRILAWTFLTVGQQREWAKKRCK